LLQSAPKANAEGRDISSASSPVAALRRI